MKALRLLSVSTALLLICSTAQAQITPQAIIGNAPSLPTPEQWAANKGHTEAFMAKLGELQAKLNDLLLAAIPTINADEMAAAKAKQEMDIERQRQQQQRDAQQGMDEAAAMGFSQADLQKLATMSEKEAEAFIKQKMAASPEMTTMKSMGFTDTDMQKMQNMSKKQGEAYMKKRMAELGITEAEFRQRIAASGAIVLSDAEVKEEERREREAEAQGQAMQKAQEAQFAWDNQMKITYGKISEAEVSAAERVEALWKSSEPAIDKAIAWLAELGGPEEVMRGTITQEQYNARARRVEALYDDFNAGAYQIWHEYVVASQGHLKFLLPYAQAADDAQKVQAEVINRGNETMAKLQGISNNAAGVAEQYLVITASGPKVVNSK